MRVLMVHDTALDSGYGAESYVRRLVAGLREAGDEVTVLAGDVVHRGARRVLDGWDPAARRLVAERARAGRVDVVHHHNVSRELSPSVLGAAPEVPAVMTVHDLRLLGAHEHAGATPRGLAELVTAGIARRTARRRLAAVMGVSERVTRALHLAGFTGAVTVPVPVTPPRRPPDGVADCRDIGVVARLAPDKGVDHVIAAFRAAAGDHPGSRLLIAGDGECREQLARQAAPLGDRVRFLGRLEEAGVSELLGRLRLVVVASVPSRRPEGSSLATVEAAAHGRPVLASDDPAVVELAGELGGVVVVPAGDVTALATAMAELLTDADGAAALGARNRAAVDARHSVAVVTAATREVYRAAIGRAP